MTDFPITHLVDSNDRNGGSLCTSISGSKALKSKNLPDDSIFYLSYNIENW
jgi:hypothetical protein